MRQTTFDDVRETVSIENLTSKQVSIVRLLATGATQGMISRQMRISRSSVSQTCRLLEQSNLIKKAIGERYNILYEISPHLIKRIGGSAERLTPVRVHNITLKFAVLKQDHPLSKDKRTGFNKEWKMRGGQRYAYFFPGKAGEFNATVTVHPRTVVIRMDAGQRVLAKDNVDARVKGLQHLVHVRQRFIDAQRLFGVDVEIEPTGKEITRAHGGLAFHEGGPLDSETRIPGTWVDNSAKKELGPGFKEFEMHVSHDMMTPLEQGVMAVAGMPDMIRSCIDPLSQNIQRVEALIQGERTDGQKVIALMDVVGHLLDRMMKLEERLESKS